MVVIMCLMTYGLMLGDNICPNDVYSFGMRGYNCSMLRAVVVLYEVGRAVLSLHCVWLYFGVG